VTVTGEARAYIRDGEGLRRHVAVDVGLADAYEEATASTQTPE